MTKNNKGRNGGDRATLKDFENSAYFSDNSIEARRDLDILMPAARVHELRHRFGYLIQTNWAHEPTDCGKLHRVARYVLAGGAA